MKNYFLEEKLEYEDIEVPDELLLLVRQTVAADRRKKAVKRRNYMIKLAGSIAAIFIIGIGITVNSSYAAAKTVVKIPVVNSMAKAMIIRSYKAEVITAAEEELQQKKQKAENELSLPEVEVAAGISENDIEVSENEPESSVTEETKETKQPSEAEGIEAWKAGVTLEELNKVTEVYTPEMEEAYAGEPEKLRTILLAALPDKNVFLYGYHEKGEVKGVVLRVKDDFKFYDWIYMNGSGKLPEICCTDMDHDDIEEIAVLLYNENIGAEAAKDKAAAFEVTNKDKTTAAETADKNKTAAEEANKTAAEEKSAEESTSGESVKVSENPADADNNENKENAETVKDKQKSAQSGELWIVSPTGDSWKTNMLAWENCEAELLKQLKAEYNEKAKTMQLSVMEEPLGEAVSIAEEEINGFRFEALKAMPEMKFILKDGVFVKFGLKAIWKNEEGESKEQSLNTVFQADVSCKDGELVLENIREYKTEAAGDVSGTDTAEEAVTNQTETENGNS